ncbi:MAG: ArsR family transcriptional regulator [archaeon]
MDKGKTPSMLARSLNVNLSHVSRALSELSAKGLVKCLTPKARKGKIFKRTKQGNALIKAMEKI